MCSTKCLCSWASCACARVRSSKHNWPELKLHTKLESTLGFHTDSKSLYDCLGRVKETSEKRLLIHLGLLSHGFIRHEMSEAMWIPLHQNRASTLTKAHRQTLKVHWGIKTNFTLSSSTCLIVHVLPILYLISPEHGFDIVVAAIWKLF